MEKKAAKRNLFSELMVGVGEMRLHREKKITLKTTKVEQFKFPKVTPTRLKAIRERLQISRGVLASIIQVNIRTLENWEQGRTSIPPYVWALILLLEEYPDTVERLKTIAA
jgi:putative transcriptional regulator